LHDVIFGINFHWNEKNIRHFKDRCVWLRENKESPRSMKCQWKISYKRDLVGNECDSAMDLLKAHAITSRSWLVAMLEMKKKFSNLGIPSQRTQQSATELVRYYDREDHDIFDVCADDHCQRYQGITKDISNAAIEAINQTRGIFLVHNNEICDARFSKSCGGLSEPFHTTWAETPFEYLTTVSCSKNIRISRF